MVKMNNGFLIILLFLYNCFARLDSKTKRLPLKENSFQHFELILKPHAIEIFVVFGV